MVKKMTLRYIIRGCDTINAEESDSFAVEERDENDVFTNNICWFSGPDAKRYAEEYVAWKQHEAELAAYFHKND